MEKNINIELMNEIRSCANIIKRSRQKETEHPQGYGRIMWAICFNDGLTQSQLADILDIRPQSLTRALADLEEKGMIERKRSSQDRRIVTVHATAQGIDYHQEMALMRKNRAENIFGCLNDEEKKDLLELVSKVVDHHNRAEGSDPS